MAGALPAPVGLQPEGYTWEGRNRRKIKKNTLVEMKVSSGVLRELGFGCSPLRPEAWKARSCLTRTAWRSWSGPRRLGPAPSTPPASRAGALSELSLSTPQAQRELGGDPRALLSSRILTHQRGGQTHRPGICIAVSGPDCTHPPALDRIPNPET